MITDLTIVCVTQQENCKISAQNRDYSFAVNNHKNRNCVKPINRTTEEVTFFKSMHAVQHLGINAGIVKMVRGQINMCKTDISKMDGYHYEF